MFPQATRSLQEPAKEEDIPYDPHPPPSLLQSKAANTLQDYYSRIHREGVIKYQNQDDCIKYEEMFYIIAKYLQGLPTTRHELEPGPSLSSHPVIPILLFISLSLALEVVLSQAFALL